MANKNRKQRKMRPTRRLAAVTRSKAAYSLALSTSSGGLITLSLPGSNFGLASGATYQMTSHNLVLTTSALAYFPLRVIHARFTYMPTYGNSATYGQGNGAMGVQNYQNASITSPTVQEVMALAKRRFLRAGIPASINWAPRVLNDEMWVVSSVSNLFATSSLGFMLYLAMAGCFGSIIVGTLEVEFDIESKVA